MSLKWLKSTAFVRILTVGSWFCPQCRQIHKCCPPLEYSFLWLSFSISFLCKLSQFKASERRSQYQNLTLIVPSTFCSNQKDQSRYRTFPQNSSDETFSGLMAWPVQCEIHGPTGRDSTFSIKLFFVSDKK